MPVWGDPRRHTNWLNHPLYKKRLALLDEEDETACHGWEVMLPGSNQPWLAAKFPLGTRLRDIGQHNLSPARPWMLVSPPGHDRRLYIYPSLQEAVNVLLEVQAQDLPGADPEGEDALALIGL